MTDNDNSEEIQILVIYYTNSKILYKKEFSSFSTFGSVLDYFDNNIKKQQVAKLKNKYYCNNKEITNNDLLINIIQPFLKNKKILSANLSLEVEEEKENFSEKNISWYNEILQPKSNPFGIYILNTKNYSLTLKTFTKQFEDQNELNKLNENSAYCNSSNNLYISGGIYNKNNLINFWIINNQNFTIKKLYMPCPKSNHSMKYINHDNNEIIFIAGGNDLKTFYYDINNNKFVDWGNMKYYHIRPSLIYINNYVYCFDTSQKNEIIFERTNLNDVNHKWEKIVPNLDEKVDDFNNFGFASILSEGEKIMFCGGDIIYMNTYLYDINKNLIYLNNQCQDILFTFNDKNFYKINNNENIALSYSLEEDRTILISNIHNYSLKKIILNSKNFKNEKEKSIGTVNIEVKTENINKEKNNNEENKNVSYYEKKIEKKSDVLENGKLNDNLNIKNERHVANNNCIKNYNTEKHDFYEAEGNNFIFDSNNNKFSDINNNNGNFNNEKNKKEEKQKLHNKNEENKEIKKVNIKENSEEKIPYIINDSDNEERQIEKNRKKSGKENDDFKEDVYKEYIKDDIEDKKVKEDFNNKSDNQIGIDGDFIEFESDSQASNIDKHDENDKGEMEKFIQDEEDGDVEEYKDEMEYEENLNYKRNDDNREENNENFTKFQDKKEIKFN